MARVFGSDFFFFAFVFLVFLVFFFLVVFFVFFFFFFFFFVGHLVAGLVIPRCSRAIRAAGIPIRGGRARYRRVHGRRILDRRFHDRREAAEEFVQGNAAVGVFIQAVDDLSDALGGDPVDAWEIQELLDAEAAISIGIGLVKPCLAARFDPGADVGEHGPPLISRDRAVAVPIDSREECLAGCAQRLAHCLGFFLVQAWLAVGLAELQDEVGHGAIAEEPVFSGFLTVVLGECHAAKAGSEYPRQ
ncbi:hypothetical protein BH23VER1_BH23VER1_03670 [soil metagenome]